MTEVIAFGITICLVAGAILPAALFNRRSFPLAADARDHPPWPTPFARAVRSGRSSPRSERHTAAAGDVVIMHHVAGRLPNGTAQEMTVAARPSTA
jgi:hypothetical protein